MTGSLFALLVIGGINTVLGLFYYVRVLKVMILERPVEELEGKDADAGADCRRSTSATSSCWRS